MIIAVLAAASVVAPMQARPLKLGQPSGPPKGTPPLAAEAWPFPPPDPKSWWDEKRPKPDEAANPLGGRRLRRGEHLPVVDNGVDPSTYRLWGLVPLQWQLLRDDELILEVWTRPSNSVRQTVSRVIVRDDGEAFVEARAGLACCEAGIGRRIGFDARLPAGSAGRLRALKDLPLWASPHDVEPQEAGAVAGLCIEGANYDITLLTRRRSISLHRACDPAAIGQAADVLEAVLGAALGHDPRFDVLFPGGASFAAARSAYHDLIESGGGLRPRADAAAQGPRPGYEPEPSPEPPVRPAAAVLQPPPPPAGPAGPARAP